MVVVSNEAAAAGAFRRIAGRQIQTKTLNPSNPTWSRVLSQTPQATLPLVTRMFLLGLIEAPNTKDKIGYG